MSSEEAMGIATGIATAKALADGVQVWCQHEKLVPVEELRANPRNPNTHPEGQIEMLARNIQHFGWRHPITVSRRSGCIVAGHGRLMAAQRLGLRIVPVDTQDFASDSDELAVLVADNRLAELAVVDNAELGRIVGELKADGLDAVLAGFSDDDLADLLADESCDDASDAGGESDTDDVTVAVGEFRCRVDAARFAAWKREAKSEDGCEDKADFEDLIRRRLHL
ncbi:hypothetical protein DB346_05460 [Verrucomicrobia bacterium LW23]|nr:hypothetical protein DB346_05460 [Verrucomicrobia bacterium LW23]